MLFLILFPLSLLALLMLRHNTSFRQMSLLVSFAPLFWSLGLWALYDSAGASFQFVTHVPALHLSFGIDSFGLALITLTSGLFPLCVFLMRSPNSILCLLALEYVLLASMLVLDLLGFYILFEASLIFLFFLIFRPHTLTRELAQKPTLQTPRFGAIDAAYKIVLYTMAGSLLFLPAVFLLYCASGSTHLFVLLSHTLPQDAQVLLGWAFFVVFAVKIPLIPVHLWLPEAHVAAPTAGSILLAGVLLKLGGLGLIRFVIPLFPAFVVSALPLLTLLCLLSFLFSSLSTLRQTDLKKIVAYSSIAHMALVTLTLFSLSESSAAHATFMMIAHGLVSPALFLLVGFLYDRTHTKFLHYYTGLATLMPLFASFFFLFTLANLSFPLFPNFIAELLCLLSLSALHPLLPYVFCICQILAALYGFGLFTRVMFGSPHILRTSSDLTRHELALVMPLFLSVLWLGIKPLA